MLNKELIKRTAEEFEHMLLLMRDKYPSDKGIVFLHGRYCDENGFINQAKRGEINSIMNRDGDLKEFGEYCVIDNKTEYEKLCSVFIQYLNAIQGIVPNYDYPRKDIAKKYADLAYEWINTEQFKPFLANKEFMQIFDDIRNERSNEKISLLRMFMDEYNSIDITNNPEFNEIMVNLYVAMRGDPNVT